MSTRGERLIRDLHWSLQLAARDLLYRAGKEDIELCVTQGKRTKEEQDELYAQGRTKPGPIVTWARGGSSWHNYGLALDVAVLKDGKPTWPNDVELWRRIGEIGEAVGLEWGGRWEKPDRPHFQHRGGLALAAVRLGEMPRYAAGEQPKEPT